PGADFFAPRRRGSRSLEGLQAAIDLAADEQLGGGEPLLAALPVFGEHFVDVAFAVADRDDLAVGHLGSERTAVAVAFEPADAFLFFNRSGFARGGLAVLGGVARVNQGVPQAQRQALRGDDEVVVGEEATALRAGEGAGAEEFFMGAVVALGGVLQEQDPAVVADLDAFEEGGAVRSEDFFLSDVGVLEKAAGGHRLRVTRSTEALLGLL